MQKKAKTIPFAGTQEQAEQVQALVSEHAGDDSHLMTVMQQTQDIYGYLPFEVQVMIAEGMNIPLEKVYGVATFYGQFTLTPKGKYNVSVCLGTACYVKGAGKIISKVCEELGIEEGEVAEDGEFSIEASRCIGACGLAPVLTVNEDVYGKVTEANIPEILAKYK